MKLMLGLLVAMLAAQGASVVVKVDEVAYRIFRTTTSAPSRDRYRQQIPGRGTYREDIVVQRLANEADEQGPEVGHFSCQDADCNVTPQQLVRKALAQEAERQKEVQ